jgi:hypothetical protein
VEQAAAQVLPQLTVLTELLIAVTVVRAVNQILLIPQRAAMAALVS